jgi:hypothetical protein
MIHSPIKYLVLFVSLVFSTTSVLYGQIIDSKNKLSISAGNAIFTSQDNLFFPKQVSNGSISLRGDFLHTILPWVKLGIEGSMIMPKADSQRSSEFTKIDNRNEKIVTAGINVTFNLPYEASGWRNRLRLQFGIAPLAVVHLGERTVKLDNKIWNNENGVNEEAIITMDGPKTGLGLSFTPALEYFLSRNIGIRFSFNSLLTSMKSDLTREDLIINSLNLGVFVQLPKKEKKELNY